MRYRLEPMKQRSAVQYLSNYARAVLRRPQTHRGYNTPDVIGELLARDQLFLPEQTIGDRLSEWLSGKSVLDVGVGAGRTSEQFGAKAGRYLGVDYSAGLIAACNRRFSQSHPRFEFQIGDARTIRDIDGEWDLIFFSFNGVDHLELDDRNTFFCDVRAMLSPAGRFWFSSHNIRNLPDVYKFSVAKGPTPRQRLDAVLFWVLVRLANPSRRRLATQRHAMINDGSYGFGLQEYYGEVEETIEQLRNAGFATITVFGMDGVELSSVEYGSTTDSWLTYLCW